eukprot:10233131-Alexandrium_andersonii.AAC.1
MGISDFRRCGAADGAVWPVGHAGTAACSGWILGPERILARNLRDRPGVRSFSCRRFKHVLQAFGA